MKVGAELRILFICVDNSITFEASVSIIFEYK